MICNLDQAAKESARLRRQKKIIGLVTGCFDVLHFEHIMLFRFAKQHCDYLIVAIENNKTISLSKGKTRPINKLKYRVNTLDELKSIDLVFVVKEAYSFDDQSKADAVFSNIYQKIKPHRLFITPQVDSFWRQKKRTTQQFGIELVCDTRQRTISSTSIIGKLIKG